MKILRMIKPYIELNTHQHTIRLFSIVINLWIIINATLLLPGHENFWSSSAYIEKQNFAQFTAIEKVFGVLWHESLGSLYPVFITLQIICALSVIFGKNVFLSQLVVTWTTINLDQKASVILDGGNNLIHILLIYLPFMLIAQKGFNPFKNMVSNWAFLIARLQIVAVYLMAGLSKLQGDLWPSGTALYYTMGVREFGHPLLFELMSTNPIVSVFSSYATLAFQISLPFLIWNRKLRPVYLFIGTLFHISIAFGMGLMSFGFAMCSTYFLFYQNSKSKEILEKLKSITKSKHPIHVAFDHDCKVCMMFSKLLTLIDIRKDLRVESAQNPLHPLLKNQLKHQRLETLHLVTNEKIYTGYSALHKIISSFPTLMPFIAYSFLLKWSGIGEYLYKKFFAKAKWRQSCQKNQCRLSPSN